VGITINLIEGVLSSFIAVALIELYLAARKRIRDYPLRKILDRPDRIGLITPEFSIEVRERDRIGPLMATHDAIALAHLLEACRKANASSALFSVSQLAEDLPRVTIAIGGPVSNAITSLHLRKYCVNFQPISKTGYTEGFEIQGSEGRGGRPAVPVVRFSEDLETTWSFIIRLGGSMTGRSGTMILVWGATAHATATAAYYLVNNAKNLPWKKDNFFAALSADRKLGYRSVQRNPIDVSSQVFSKLTSSAG
jgi:hypothetical protein